MKQWTGVLIGLGALVVLCCSLGVLASLGEQTDSDPTAIVAATEIATEPPAPTAEPTDEPPVEPTSAPTATPEPVPTATPEPTTDPVQTEMAAYIIALQGQLETFATASTELAELLQNVRATDDAWVLDVAARTVIIEQVYTDLNEITPPDPAMDVHAMVVDALADCNAAMPIFRQGFDANDIVQITEANLLVQSCGQKLTDAQPHMQTFVQEYGE